MRKRTQRRYSLIHALVAWWHDEDPTPPLTEIVVFESFAAARGAGFDSSGVLRGYEHVRAYWPGQGIRGLAMRPIRRVTIPERLMHLNIGGEGELWALLRSRQQVFGTQAVWMTV